MPRYRFPGKTPVPAICNKKPDRKPFTTIKACPKPPYIKDSICNPNIYDRALIRHTPDSLKFEVKPKFLIETFSGLILCPINLKKFCGYDFKDGEIVAVEAEDLSKVICKKDYGNFDDLIPVQLFKIKRVSPLLIHEATGIVTLEVDSNGIPYHMLTEITNPPDTKPFIKTTENILFYEPIVIRYEIYNIMNVQNPEAVMKGLEGTSITATYVDYGEETKERIGLPIVITQYTTNIQTP